jgi:hypothetical protein
MTLVLWLLQHAPISNCKIPSVHSVTNIRTMAPILSGVVTRSGQGAGCWNAQTGDCHAVKGVRPPGFDPHQRQTSKDGGVVGRPERASDYSTVAANLSEKPARDTDTRLKPPGDCRSRTRTWSREAAVQHQAAGRIAAGATVQQGRRQKLSKAGGEGRGVNAARRGRPRAHVSTQGYPSLRSRTWGSDGDKGGAAVDVGARSVPAPEKMCTRRKIGPPPKQARR